MKANKTISAKTKAAQKGIQGVIPDILKPLQATGVPCLADGEDSIECPYMHKLNPERTMAGMPFIDGDSRSCWMSGHICPKFMEDFGLTPEDLRRRAAELHIDFRDASAN